MSNKNNEVILLKKVIVAVLFVCLALLASCDKIEYIDINESKYIELYGKTNGFDWESEGLTWAEEQALPIFAPVVGEIDAINVTKKSNADKSLLVSLQGIVNRKNPRIALYMENTDGFEKWLMQSDIEYRFIGYDEAILKYKEEINGIIIYDSQLRDTINLANTVAGLEDAIVCTEKQAENLGAEPYNFEIIANFNNIFGDKIEVYEYLYNNYWKNCTKRLIVGLNPSLKAECLMNIRDVAIAAKAAVIWLDPKEVYDRLLLEKFFGDCQPGETTYLGWWTDEGVGINVASKYGIPTVPADFYENYSVYSGASRELEVPEVPAKPKLKNKFYISFIMAEGDNLQYCQHALKTSKNLWQNSMRGEYPISWTVSLALYDAGPQILNYYYKTATPNDCIISGPSGVGYTDPIAWGIGIPTIEDFEKYAKKNEIYLRKTGIRVITVWHQISDSQASIYAKNTPYLYGFSVQERFPNQETQCIIGNENSLPLITTYPRYDEDLLRIQSIIETEISNWDGTSPYFMAPQFESWSCSITDINRIARNLENKYGDKIELVRVDHLMMLMSEFNNERYNIILQSNNLTASGFDEEYLPNNIVDGSFAKEKGWQSSNEGEKWVVIDLGDEYEISRYNIILAGAGYFSQDQNIRNFKIQASYDGENWQDIHTVEDNNKDIIDVIVPSFETRFVRILVLDSGSDNTARIQEFELYGFKSNA